MMREIHLLSAFALFWASSFGSTGALKCFTCSSDVKTNCGDPFYNVSVDMPSCGHEMDQGICTKTVTSEDVVTRGCGLKSFCQQDAGEDGCKETAGTTRCCCAMDGCNSATKRIVDHLLLTAITFSAVVVNWKLP